MLRTVKTQPKIKLNRTFPKRPNFCKLTVHSNALNFLGHEEKFGERMTPESLLSKLNEVRLQTGLEELDPHVTVVPSEELESFFDKEDLGKMISIQGAQCLKPELIEELVNKNFLLSVDHQSVYYNPAENNWEITLKYIPEELIVRASTDREFRYEYLLEIYKHLIAAYGELEEGHVDLLLDFSFDADLPYGLLANLNSKNNEEFIKVPWHFFANYLMLDWSTNEKLKSVLDLPTEKEFEKLRKDGYLDDGKFGFGYGLVDIFYKKEQEGQLKEILGKYK